MKYIVAVSGGVDSMVLLSMLDSGRLPGFSKTDVYIVAHFDHGIRAESGSDSNFVKQLAADYGFQFEVEEGELGSECSEELARKARYDFLRRCLKKYNASAIVLAHHEDDLIETAIINLLRGTGWRGLCSLRSTNELRRPLLSYPKQELIKYAQLNNLSWVEDETNLDVNYTRNLIRHHIIPIAQADEPSFRQLVLEYVRSNNKLRTEIDELLSAVAGVSGINKHYSLQRYNITMYPDIVTREVIYTVLRSLDYQYHPTRSQIIRVLHFCKTARVGSRFEIASSMWIESKKHTLEFKIH